MKKREIILEKKELFFTLFIMTLIIMWAYGGTGFSIFKLIGATPRVARFFIVDFFPPNFKSTGSFFMPLLDTIYMAVFSVFLGGFTSFILAILASSKTTPHRVFYLLTRFIVGVFRNIPTLVWATLLVPAFGIGKSVGILALYLSTVGTLTRAFAESIDAIDEEILETLYALGARYPQVIFQGVIPEVAPSIVSWSFYSLEINIRSSAIIGMVGGGGVGLFIQSTIKLFRYREAAAALMAMGVVVFIVEYMASRVRRVIL